jgi:FMN phosphatase YigB (HAD superfamily)
MKQMQEILNRAKQIELIIFDVDGVLTDSTLYLGDDGQEYKRRARDEAAAEERRRDRHNHRPHV